MAKKRRLITPTEFWDDLPEKDPYSEPEFKDEMFSDLMDEGFKPENLQEPYRSDFKTWLEKKKRTDET